MEMNTFYCISIGSFMLAHACRMRDSDYMVWYVVIGLIAAVLGGVIK